MASCPKCGKKLRLTDISQYCPACGVNMRFVNFEEDFIREAKIAELSQAAMHVKIKRFKASFVGSKLTIARLIVMLLPLLSLLLPHGSFTLTLPYKEATVPFSALGLYALFSQGDLQYFTSMTASAFAGGVFSALLAALYAYAATAAFAALALLLSVLGFISIKNMQKIIAATACLGIAADITAMVLIARFVSTAAGSPLFITKNGFSLIITILMFAAVLVVNLLLIRRPVPVEYDEGMTERARLWKPVRSGRIDVNTLPLPVVETAETRKIDEEIAKAEADYNKKHAKEATADGSGQ